MQFLVQFFFFFLLFQEIKLQRRQLTVFWRQKESIFRFLAAFNHKFLPKSVINLLKNDLTVSQYPSVNLNFLAVNLSFHHVNPVAHPENITRVLETHFLTIWIQ